MAVEATVLSSPPVVFIVVVKYTYTYVQCGGRQRSRYQFFLFTVYKRVSRVPRTLEKHGAQEEEHQQLARCYM